MKMTSAALHWLGTLHMVGLGLTGGRAQATSFTTGLSAKAASAVQKGHTAQCPFETLVEFRSFCVPADLWVHLHLYQTAYLRLYRATSFTTGLTQKQLLLYTHYPKGTHWPVPISFCVRPDFQMHLYQPYLRQSYAIGVQIYGVHRCPHISDDQILNKYTYYPKGTHCPFWTLVEYQ